MNILIAGGSGVIGTHLTELLIQNGHTIFHVGRSIPNVKNQHVKYFVWHDLADEILVDDLLQIQIIINLAGENISGKRWSEKQKKIISESRFRSNIMLYNYIKIHRAPVQLAIAASAIGIYGCTTGNFNYSETDAYGTDFIAKTCIDWENYSIRFNKFNIRTVQYRFGIVLDKNAGALAKMSVPVKLGIGAAIGTGKQYMPWVHIKDVCKAILFAINNESINGVYNLVAPEAINNEDFTKSLSEALHKPFWKTKIPSFILKLWYGEMSVILLTGSSVSSNKLIKSGFKFEFNMLSSAFKNLFS